MSKLAHSIQSTMDEIELRKCYENGSLIDYVESALCAMRAERDEAVARAEKMQKIVDAALMWARGGDDEPLVDTIVAYESQSTES